MNNYQIYKSENWGTACKWAVSLNGKVLDKKSFTKEIIKKVLPTLGDKKAKKDLEVIDIIIKKVFTSPIFFNCINRIPIINIIVLHKRRHVRG